MDISDKQMTQPAPDSADKSGWEQLHACLKEELKTVLRR